MAGPMSSAGAMLTDFFSADHSEARARQTGFVQRASKITGKLWLPLVTFGPWSAAKTTVAQLAATVTQLGEGVEGWPEAIQQRMPPRALAFVGAMSQSAVAKFHAAHTMGAEGLFAPFPRGYIADSTGFGLADRLKDSFPGAGGRAAQAGAKIHLVWVYTSRTVAPFALLPWNIPDNNYIDTVVGLARQGALLLCDLGDFKTPALAGIVAAAASFLSRLNPQVALFAVGGGRWPPRELAQLLKTEPRPLLEKALFRGAQDRVAARLVAARVPEAVGNDRRRRARKTAKKKGSAPSHAHLTRLAWNLFITTVPGSVWAPHTVLKVYPLRGQVELICKSWKSYLPLATLTTKKVETTLGYLSGRLLLILLTSALCPSLRARLWAQKRRELSGLKLVRHFQALADRWLQVLFQSTFDLYRFLHRACAAAERLVAKASRKRRTTAQVLHASLRTQNEALELAMAVNA